MDLPTSPSHRIRHILRRDISARPQPDRGTLIHSLYHEHAAVHVQHLPVIYDAASDTKNRTAAAMEEAPTVPMEFVSPGILTSGGNPWVIGDKARRHRVHRHRRFAYSRAAIR